MAQVKEHVMGVYLLCLGIVTALVIGLGMTTSSIGALTDTGSQSKSIVSGEPLAIRSDEFLRATPSQLSYLQGGNSNSLFDYTQSEFFIGAQKNPIESLKQALNFDYVVISSVAKSLPIDNGFSLMWWLYSLMALIFIPLWLRELNISPGLSIIAGILTWLVPTNHWWSMWPLVSVGLASFAGFLLLKFAKSTPEAKAWKAGNTLRFIFFGVLTASVASRIPFTYQPWAIPVTLFFFSITVAEVFFSKKYSARQKYASGLAVLGGLFLTALYFWGSRDLYTNLLSTVYPGQRRSGTSETNVPIWAGPIDWQFQFLNYSDFIQSNQSELAIGLLILIPVSFASFFSTKLGLRHAWNSNAKTFLGLLVSGIFLVWTLAPWPSQLLKFNPLTFLPPERVAQILGVLVIVLFILAISNLTAFKSGSSDQVKKLVSTNSIGIALFVLIISMFGIQGLKQFVSPGQLQPKEIWLTALLAALVVVAPLLSKKPVLALAPLLAFSIFSISTVNPIMVGAGEILDSQSAKSVRQGVESNTNRWASDDWFVDALLIANGANMLSGQQGTGPNYGAWEELDKSHTYIDAWNRGSNYVVFVWDETAINPKIVNPTPDVIQVFINPCDDRLSKLDLGWIASRSKLSSTCLELHSQSKWMDRDLFTYQLVAAK